MRLFIWELKRLESGSEVDAQSRRGRAVPAEGTSRPWSRRYGSTWHVLGNDWNVGCGMRSSGVTWAQIGKDLERQAKECTLPFRQ